MVLSVTWKQQTQSFVTLNDVLLYINNASQTEKRCIQIALNDRRNIYAVNPVPVETSGIRRKYFWRFKYYFLRSFRANSLTNENLKIVLNYCDQYGYDVKNIQFERFDFGSFIMTYRGDDRTYTFFIISNNEVTGG